MENYHKPSCHNFTNKITTPGCRCTNKESCLVKNSSTSNSHAPPPSKELIAPTQILENAPELYHIWMWVVIFLDHHMGAIQLSPILLLAHHKLQFY
jgi:hypothetical protein